MTNDLRASNTTPSYDEFETIYLNVLEKHAPCKIKIIRANEAPSMNRELKKSRMTRSRLKNKYLRSPPNQNILAYKVQRNVCTNLLRKRKRDYYNNLDTMLISDNKTFWNTVKPLFSDKINMSQKITLINDNNIISENSEIAKIFNEYFCTVATKFNIEDTVIHITDTQNTSDPILKAIKKYENHPSIIKITENIITKEVFKFPHASCKDIETVVNSVDISKATICRNIPTKVFKQNFDICSGVITSIYNSCIIAPNFPSNMKYANINPVHKKR